MRYFFSGDFQGQEGGVHYATLNTVITWPTIVLLHSLTRSPFVVIYIWSIFIDHNCRIINFLYPFLYLSILCIQNVYVTLETHIKTTNHTVCSRFFLTNLSCRILEKKVHQCLKIVFTIHVCTSTNNHITKFNIIYLFSHVRNSQSNTMCIKL